MYNLYLYNYKRQTKLNTKRVILHFLKQFLMKYIYIYIRNSIIHTCTSENKFNPLCNNVLNYNKIKIYSQ